MNNCMASPMARTFAIFAQYHLLGFPYQSRTVSTELERGNHEPHRHYSHQEPEVDFANRNDVIGGVYLDVQREARENHPKPDDQSKRHEHRYANEMFHPTPSEQTRLRRSLSL
jgi:hypothetical protein